VTAGRDPTVELLHALGHIHMRHGQRKRGLVLLLIAARLAPDDDSILRTLADAFLIEGSSHNAAAVIDRLQGMETQPEPTLELFRSHALWLAGHEHEARQTFHNFLERRERS
jgi:type III secretion protein Y